MPLPLLVTVDCTRVASWQLDRSEFETPIVQLQGTSTLMQTKSVGRLDHVGCVEQLNEDVAQLCHEELIVPVGVYPRR